MASSRLLISFSGTLVRSYYHKVSKLTIRKIIMQIGELSHDTLKLVCVSLNDGLSTGYKALIAKMFTDLYSHEEVIEIEKRRNPAKKLLQDLNNRQIPVERLLEGLEAIGNIKAINIIMKDVMKRGKTLNLPKDNPYSGYCSTRQPQEHRDGVVIEVAGGTSSLPYPTREQVKTYRAPVQETLINSSQ